jgi:hypothetical protein
MLGDQKNVVALTPLEQLHRQGTQSVRLCASLFVDVLPDGRIVRQHQHRVTLKMKLERLKRLLYRQQFQAVDMEGPVD